MCQFMWLQTVSGFKSISPGCRSHINSREGRARGARITPACKRKGYKDLRLEIWNFESCSAAIRRRDEKLFPRMNNWMLWRRYLYAICSLPSLVFHPSPVPTTTHHTVIAIESFFRFPSVQTNEQLIAIMTERASERPATRNPRYI